MDLFSSPSVVGSQAAFSVHVCVLRVCVRAESSSQGQWCYFPAFLQEVQRLHCSLFIIDHHVIDLNGHSSQFNFIYTVSVAIRIVSGPG